MLVNFTCVNPKPFKIKTNEQTDKTNQKTRLLITELKMQFLWCLPGPLPSTTHIPMYCSEESVAEVIERCFGCPKSQLLNLN